jgi:hypothetical protein
MRCNVRLAVHRTCLQQACALQEAVVGRFNGTFHHRKSSAVDSMVETLLELKLLLSVIIGDRTSSVLYTTVLCLVSWGIPTAAVAATAAAWTLSNVLISGRAPFAPPRTPCCTAGVNTGQCWSGEALLLHTYAPPRLVRSISKASSPTTPLSRCEHYTLRCGERSQRR